MELVIVLVIFAVVVWFIFFRDKKDVREALAPAPYKLEPEAPNEPVPAQPVTEVLPAPVVEQSVVQQEEKPSKAKRTTKPKSEKSTTKAPAKAKKPKMTVAK